MNILTSSYDIIFLGIIAFSAILALIRGGITELLSLSVWFIAFWVMHRYGTWLDNYLPNSVTNQLARSCIIFMCAFIAVAIGMAIIKRLCASIISSIGLGGLNYLLGFAFGIIRGILFCAVLIIVIEMLNLDPANSWQNSRLYPVLAPAVEWIANTIPSRIKELPPPTGTLLQPII
jgi:membrane protein required for colicin V production